ncbi:alpha/beta fold hydrolase [Tabrizicola sp.]|uniref:RBBP9/YdeN family alpha/beta hydrolase n=1 Tax=Tabrizicola sp. TaxID=2005166 RepID=UPI00286AF143|nr:alpha/beta fold hydrolase [Tabrizicola sp.]
MGNLLDDYDFLVLPCRDNSGPGHWQSHWQVALPNMTRVEQDEWVSPKFAPWAARLDEYLGRSVRPVVLIAHSLGTSLIMRWAPDADCSRIAGAFMVAPSDRGAADIWPDASESGFSPMVLDPLPFPSMVLASRNDPYVAFDRARTFADAWRAELVDMQQAGHMGNSDNLGIWPAGLVHFGAFIGTLGGRRTGVG